MRKLKYEFEYSTMKQKKMYFFVLVNYYIKLNWIF